MASDNTATEQGASATKWVEQNTSIIIVHGIGSQNPIETLDQFARGLIAEFGGDIELQHYTIPKPDSSGSLWFDNFLRIAKPGNETYIDVYEYYWANYTENKAGFDDISYWLQGVAKGASKYYYAENNKAIGLAYGDSSIFFKNGKFRGWLYYLLIYLAPMLLMSANMFFEYLFRLLSYIPLVGIIAGKLLSVVRRNKVRQIIDLLGDVTIYNTMDAKSEFYTVRREIMDGAVKAIRHLIEKEEDGQLAYPRVLVAGHSLGSQISYDALNRINHLINVGNIRHYNEHGNSTHPNEPEHHIAQRFSGYVTFGSPLDKIAFFLRKNVEEQEYIREQMLNSYHCFKQRNWSVQNHFPHLVQPAFKRHLEGVLWKNYYDDRDPVSGALDFYDPLLNVNLNFKKGLFTHSNYWTNSTFYKDIIQSFF